MRRALDVTDKESVTGWLDALEAARADAEAAAADAARSRRKRTLSRAEIGRQLTEALDRIGELIDAARRGLGPTLKSKPDTPEEPPPSEPSA